jgi:gamma-glutamyltranspeptidase/glutathione hydrolase
MMNKFIGTAVLALAYGAAGGGEALAYGAPKMQTCESSPQPVFCGAVRGARSEGWPAQSRSEVMAQHGMVVASQPLAAQAGLQMLQHGGNAIDAAVATAAVLNVTEPMMVGMGGDLFAVIYIAKEKKIYVLNASGVAPTGATVEHYNQLGYAWNSKNFWHAGARYSHRHGAGCRLGMGVRTQALRQTDIQRSAGARGAIRAERLSDFGTHRT